MKDGVLVSCPCMLNKRHGVTEVTGTTLKWTPVDNPEKSLVIPFWQIKAIHINTSSTDKHLLKITLVDLNVNKEHMGYLFHFCGDNAGILRDNIKGILAEHIAKLRLLQGKKIKHGDNTSNNPSTDAIEQKEVNIQDHIINRSPKLLKLYKELVGNNVITKQDFWSNKQSMIQKESASYSQIKGISSAIITDLRPTTAMGGEIKYTLDTNIIYSIFVQYPDVYKAYKECVPNILNEKDFWVQYFQSKLFSREENAIMDDYNILNKYFLKVDDNEGLKVFERDGFSGYPYLSGEIKPLCGNANTRTLVNKFNRHSRNIINLILNGEENNLRSLSFETAQMNRRRSSYMDGIMNSISNITVTLTIDKKEEYLDNFNIYKRLEQTEDGHLGNLENGVFKNVDYILKKIDNTKSRLIEDEDKWSEIESMVTLENTGSEREICTEGVSEDVLSFHSNLTEILGQFWSSVQMKDDYERDKNMRMLVLLEGFSDKLNSILKHRGNDTDRGNRDIYGCLASLKLSTTTAIKQGRDNRKQLQVPIP